MRFAGNKVSWSARARIASGVLFWVTTLRKHQGKAAIVIGNGPSLNVRDLEKIRHCVSIASNKIYLAFGETQWRPDYYTVADRLVWQKIAATLVRKNFAVLIPAFLPQMAGVREVCWRDLGSAQRGRRLPFSTNGVRGFYGASTVTYYNLQIAAHMGCNPIYLIGCDHYYAGEKDVQSEVPVSVGKAVNHFHPDYRQEGELVNPAPIDLMNEAYAVAREWSDLSGVAILNATRGGHLEAFKRVEFDKVFL